MLLKNITPSLHVILSSVFVLITVFHSSVLDCTEEKTYVENTTSFENNYFLKLPYFHNNEEATPTKSTRNSIVLLDYMKSHNIAVCPPGFHKLNTNLKYCYQISETSLWNYPCFKSGGASVITDLGEEDTDNLLQSLLIKNISRYFWLPAQRKKIFNPVVWNVPGPNWGMNLQESSKLKIQTSIFKNCLLLDIEGKKLITETCKKQYQSLCFYSQEYYIPSKCPLNYHAFPFLAAEDACFGIEYIDGGSSFDSFLSKACKKPMGDNKYNNDIAIFIFQRIAIYDKLPNDAWCWFQSSPDCLNETCSSVENKSDNNSSSRPSLFKSIINKTGNLTFINESEELACMACEKEIIYIQETEIKLEYDPETMQLHLTVYFPSGLWKYNSDDTGFQCFSDANGFISVIDINNIPFIRVDDNFLSSDNETTTVEKSVYEIELVAKRSAQYWCEAHTKNFSLISTSKIIANPLGDMLHVFALVVNVTVYKEEEDLNFTKLIDNILETFQAETVILMDILLYTSEQATLVFHLHVAVNEYNRTEEEVLPLMLENLEAIGIAELPKYNITFLNISSSIYCLPNISKDLQGFDILNWDLTLIGHIAAPKEFCLQSNGLPVKRLCQGSYLLGGYWGEVDGYCDKIYKASETTSFLYNVFKGYTSENFTSHFLTKGLNFVLGNLDIIIPADVYYLSMSFQHIIDISKGNDTSIELGDVDNIVWAMDRIMDIDKQYLRLSQTLNSTNVILDSVTDIIELISQKNLECDTSSQSNAYQVSLKPQFIVQISYPVQNNISGMAVLKENSHDSFENVLIHPLFKNTTLNDVLSLKNLEVAAWVPEKVLKNLKQHSNGSNIEDDKMHIIVNVFYNDIVFQQLDNAEHTINSRIIGVTIPGFISNLEYPIPILFKDIRQHSLEKICGYWEFQVRGANQNPGFWSKQGCFHITSFNNITVCECYHMTHFGELLDIGGVMYPKDKTDEVHIKALNIITLIGSMLSLLGVAGIWVTALVFQVWRKKASTKILLQLSTSIALPLILLLVFCLDDSLFILNRNGEYVIEEGKDYLCIILGAFLHYSILASFMWMLITAVLQFIRYVRVLGVSRPSRFMIKFTILGWGIPLVPVIAVLSLNTRNYIPNDSSSRICYPNGFYFIVSVLVPIFVIIIINVTLFILVIISISRKSDKTMRATDIDLVGAQLRLSIFLFFLLGLTWLFAIFSFSSNVLWSYLFCLTSTLQGFIIFIYFVILDPATRHLWVTLMKPQFSASRDSVFSISNSEIR